MKNEGKISVFACLITFIMLSLILVIIEAISFYEKKSETAIALSSATSSIMADYEDMLFERYHILLLDSNFHGEGEGCIEESIKRDVLFNMNDTITVKDIYLIETKSITDNDLDPFKMQIHDAVKYMALEDAINHIFDETKYMDKVLDDDAVKSMDKEVNKKQKVDSKEKETVSSPTPGHSRKEISEGEKEQETKSEKSNVGKFFSEIGSIGVSTFIKPDEIEFSDYYIEKKESFSGRVNKWEEFEIGFKTDFGNYENLKRDIKLVSDWSQPFLMNAEGIYYASQVFNSATNKIYDGTCLNLEREYVIFGKKTDAANFDAAIDNIIALRFPINFACLIANEKKMEELYAIGLFVEAFLYIPADVTKYLLAGSWSYAECIADCYRLVRGYRVPYLKTDANWVTDLTNFEDEESFSKALEGSCDDNMIEGLSYDDYLMILMGLHMNKAYYRMLDVMEMNERINNEKFCIDNTIIQFTVNLDASYREYDIQLIKEDGVR